MSHKNFGSWTSNENNISASKWDSTSLSDEITFQYIGNKLSSYKYYQEEGVCFIEKSFTYNAAGKILSENIKTYYDSFTVKLEPVHYAINDKKEYAYTDTVTHIKYYRNNVLQATEELISLKNGKLARQILKAANGKILQKYTYTYNNQQQLIQITSFETGYDGFGNIYDLMDYNKTILNYDATGKLISKELFSQGKLCDREKYEYLK
ncbi:hypothetical protein [Ferruginibacter albus]|uniref:hypothetical protein n=1 Tax=Ferruginibacter albus TaxID=2875540 RepID=UPI001CC5D914|nr:hypothetical protein [Ferruginibacter albus]UAY51045.1 hypothetical protein K9M53_10635 [Ferruginibacter albus]